MQRRIPDSAIQLQSHLHYALAPTSLLCLEGIDFDWYFCRRLFVQKVNEAPTHQLGTEAKVGIFGERVMLPTAAHLNRFAAPDSRRAVKVKKATGAIARRLFDYEMAV